jgi:hypothetical protein
VNIQWFHHGLAPFFNGRAANAAILALMVGMAGCVDSFNVGSQSDPFADARSFLLMENSIHYEPISFAGSVGPGRSDCHPYRRRLGRKIFVLLGDDQQVAAA